MKSRYPYVSQMRAQGQAEGLLEGLREAILRTFKHHGMTVSDEIRETISNCEDAELLDRWSDLAFVVKDSCELLLGA
jgi:hypothetical protein